MRAPWGWYRAFGRIEAATWDRPKVEIDLEVTFGLCNQMTVSQRFQSLGSRRQIHADRHNPVNQMFEPANQRITHTSQSDSTNFP